MSMSVALSIKEQKKKRNKFLFLILLFFFVAFIFALAVSFFNFNSEKNNITNSLKKEASYITDSIHSNLDSNFKILDILSKLVSDDSKLANVDNLNSLLGNPSNLGTMDSLSYVYPSGSGYTFDFVTSSLTPNDFSNNQCYHFVSSNKKCFYYDKNSDNFTYGISVNDRKGNFIGAILATQNKYKIVSLLKQETSDKKYFTYLINSNGSFVLKDPNAGFDDSTSIFKWKYSFYKFPQEAAFANSRYGFPAVKWSRGNSLEYNLLIMSNLGYNDYRILTVLPNANFKTNNSFKITKKALIFSFCGVISIFIFFIAFLNLIKMIKKKSDNMVIKWALYDEVTDGYNKPKFYLEVSKILLNAKEDDKYAMIVMDINNFKIINEIYDSIKGNSVLKDLSDSVKWFLEKDGISARIMSDNFAILYKYKREEKIINFINNLIRSLGEYKLSVKLVPSFGIFKITDYNLPIDTMIDRALMAKRTIKAELDNRFAFFSEELIEKIIAEREIENEMYFALNQKQFSIYLQPQVDVLTGDIVGAEALVRWIHPERGLLLPNKFLSLFEKNGFVTYLDQYVVEEVCKLLKKWIDNGINPFPISVNISRLHLNNPRFVSMVNSILEMYKIPSKFLNMEIGEEAFFEDINLVKKVVADLKESGYMVSIDKFGKLYSALNVLNEISVDTVKFDKNFVKEMMFTDRGKIILKHANQLVKDLYSKTFIVGIEDAEQLKSIKSIEFDYAQGFVYSRPMPILDFENFVFKKTIGNEDYNGQSMDL